MNNTKILGIDFNGLNISKKLAYILQKLKLNKNYGNKFSEKKNLRRKELVDQFFKMAMLDALGISK